MASANIDYKKCQSTMEKECQKVLDKVTTIKINATGIDYQTVLTFNAEFAVEKEFSKDDIDKFAFVHSQVKADNSQNNGYIFHPGIGAFKYTASELSGMVFEDTGYNSIYENSDNLLNEIPLYLFDAKEFNDYLNKNNITKVSDQDIEKITSNKELKVLASTTSNAAGEYRFLIPTLSETNSDVYADKYVIFVGKSDKYLIANLQSDDQNDNANKFDPNTRATAPIAKSTSKNDKFHLGLGLDVVVKETQDYHFKALNSQDMTFSDKNIAMYDLNQLFDNGNLIEPLNLSTYLKNKGNDDDQSNNTDLLCSDYIKYQRYMQSTQVKLNGLLVTPENTNCKLSAKVKDKYNQGTKDIAIRLTTFVNNSSITGELYLEDKTVEQLVSTGGEYIQDYTIKICRDFDGHCEYGEIKRSSENNVTYTIDNLVFIPNTTYHFEVLNKDGNSTRLVRVISSLMANGTSVTSQDQGQSIKYDFDVDNDAMNVDVDIYVTEDDLPTASIKPHYNAIDQSDLEEVVREDYKVNPSSFDFEAIDATTSATAQCLISDEKNIPTKEEIWAEKKIGVPSKHDNDPSNVKHEEFINYDYGANGSRKERITCVARDIVNNTSDLVSQAYDVDVDAPQVEVEITKSAKFTNPQNIKVKIQDNLDKEPKYKYSILKYDAMSGEYLALPNGKGSGYGPVDAQGNRIPGNQDKEDYLNEITIPSEAYSNLEKGKYRFKVEAMDYAGNSSITPENEWDYPGQVDFEVGKTLKGTVFKDANYDSHRNSLSSNIIMPIFNQFLEEQGIPNIVVELYKSDKKTLLASTKTNSKGQYEFDLHTVEEEKNANYEKDYYYLKIDANYNGSIQTHDNASLKAYIIGNIQKAYFSPNNNAFDLEDGEFKDSYYAKVKMDSEDRFADNFVGVDAAFGLRPSVSNSKQDEYVNKEFSLALNNLVNAQVDKNQKIVFKDKDNQVVEDDIIKCLVDQNKEQLSKTTCQASLVNEYHTELLINDLYSLNPNDEQVNRPTYKHQVKVNINELKHFSGNLQFVANDQDKNVISHTTELLEKLPLEALSLEIVSSDNQTYTANIEINNEQKIISYNFNDDITNPGDYKLRLKLDESSKAYQDGFRILNQNNELTSLHEIDLSFDNSSRAQVLVNNFRISDGLKPEISLEQNGGTIVNNRLYNPKSFTYNYQDALTFIKAYYDDPRGWDFDIEMLENDHTIDAIDIEYWKNEGYVLNYYALDSALNKAQGQPLTYYVDETPPQINVDAIKEANQVVAYEISSEDKLGFATTCKFTLQKDGVDYAEYVNQDCTKLDITKLPLGKYQILVTTSDEIGNEAVHNSTTFSISETNKVSGQVYLVKNKGEVGTNRELIEQKTEMKDLISEIDVSLCQRKVASDQCKTLETSSVQEKIVDDKLVLDFALETTQTELFKYYLKAELKNQNNMGLISSRTIASENTPSSNIEMEINFKNRNNSINNSEVVDFYITDIKNPEGNLKTTTKLAENNELLVTGLSHSAFDNFVLDQCLLTIKNLSNPSVDDVLIKTKCNNTHSLAGYQPAKYQATLSGYDLASNELIAQTNQSLSIEFSIVDRAIVKGNAQIIVNETNHATTKESIAINEDIKTKFAQSLKAQLCVQKQSSKCSVINIPLSLVGELDAYVYSIINSQPAYEKYDLVISLDDQAIDKGIRLLENNQKNNTNYLTKLEFNNITNRTRDSLITKNFYLSDILAPTSEQLSLDGGLSITNNEEVKIYNPNSIQVNAYQDLASAAYLEYKYNNDQEYTRVQEQIDLLNVEGKHTLKAQVIDDANNKVALNDLTYVIDNQKPNISIQDNANQDGKTISVSDTVDPNPSCNYNVKAKDTNDILMSKQCNGEIKYSDITSQLGLGEYVVEVIAVDEYGQKTTDQVEKNKHTNIQSFTFTNAQSINVSGQISLVDNGLNTTNRQDVNLSNELKAKMPESIKLELCASNIDDPCQSIATTTIKKNDDTYTYELKNANVVSGTKEYYLKASIQDENSTLGLLSTKVRADSQLKQSLKTTIDFKTKNVTEAKNVKVDLYLSESVVPTINVSVNEEGQNQDKYVKDITYGYDDNTVLKSCSYELYLKSNKIQSNADCIENATLDISSLKAGVYTLKFKAVDQFDNVSTLEKEFTRNEKTMVAGKIKLIENKTNHESTRQELTNVSEYEDKLVKQIKVSLCLSDSDDCQSQIVEKEIKDNKVEYNYNLSQKLAQDQKYDLKVEFVDQDALSKGYRLLTTNQKDQSLEESITLKNINNKTRNLENIINKDLYLSDTIAPTASIERTDAKVVKENIYYNPTSLDVTINEQATNADLYYQVDGASSYQKLVGEQIEVATTSGLHTIKAYVIDSANNKTTLKDIVYKIDLENPTFNINNDNSKKEIEVKSQDDVLVESCTYTLSNVNDASFEQKGSCLDVINYQDLSIGHYQLQVIVEDEYGNSVDNKDNLYDLIIEKELSLTGNIYLLDNKDDSNEREVIEYTQQALDNIADFKLDLCSLDLNNNEVCQNSSVSIKKEEDLSLTYVIKQKIIEEKDYYLKASLDQSAIDNGFSLLNDYSKANQSVLISVQIPLNFDQNDSAKANVLFTDLVKPSVEVEKVNAGNNDIISKFDYLVNDNFALKVCEIDILNDQNQSILKTKIKECQGSVEILNNLELYQAGKYTLVIEASDLAKNQMQSYTQEFEIIENYSVSGQINFIDYANNTSRNVVKANNELKAKLPQLQVELCESNLSNCTSLDVTSSNSVDIAYEYAIAKSFATTKAYDLRISLNDDAYTKGFRLFKKNVLVDQGAKQVVYSNLSAKTRSHLQTSKVIDLYLSDVSIPNADLEYTTLKGNLTNYEYLNSAITDLANDQATNVQAYYAYNNAKFTKVDEQIPLPTTQGLQNLKYYVLDSALNKSVVIEKEFYYDNAKPSLELSKSNQQIKLSVSDSVKLASCTYQIVKNNNQIIEQGACLDTYDLANYQEHGIGNYQLKVSAIDEYGTLLSEQDKTKHTATKDISFEITSSAKISGKIMLASNPSLEQGREEVAYTNQALTKLKDQISLELCHENQTQETCDAQKVIATYNQELKAYVYKLEKDLSYDDGYYLKASLSNELSNQDFGLVKDLSANQSPSPTLAKINIDLDSTKSINIDKEAKNVNFYVTETRRPTIDNVVVHNKGSEQAQRLDKITYQFKDNLALKTCSVQVYAKDDLNKVVYESNDCSKQELFASEFDQASEYIVKFNATELLENKALSVEKEFKIIENLKVSGQVILVENLTSSSQRQAISVDSKLTGILENKKLQAKLCVEQDCINKDIKVSVKNNQYVYAYSFEQPYATTKPYDVSLVLSQDKVEQGFGLLKDQDVETNPQSSYEFKNISNKTRNINSDINLKDLYLTDSLKPTLNLEYDEVTLINERYYNPNHINVLANDLATSTTAYYAIDDSKYSEVEDQQVQLKDLKDGKHTPKAYTIDSANDSAKNKSSVQELEFYIDQHGPTISIDPINEEQNHLGYKIMISDSVDQKPTCNYLITKQGDESVQIKGDCSNQQGIDIEFAKILKEHGIGTYLISATGSDEVDNKALPKTQEFVLSNDKQVSGNIYLIDNLKNQDHQEIELNEQLIELLPNLHFELCTGAIVESGNCQSVDKQDMQINTSKNGLSYSLKDAKTTVEKDYYLRVTLANSGIENDFEIFLSKKQNQQGQSVLVQSLDYSDENLMKNVNVYLSEKQVPTLKVEMQTSNDRLQQIDYQYQDNFFINTCDVKVYNAKDELVDSLDKCSETYKPTNLLSGKYTVKFNAQDLVGNKLQEVVKTFEIFDNIKVSGQIDFVLNNDEDELRDKVVINDALANVLPSIKAKLCAKESDLCQDQEINIEKVDGTYTYNYEIAYSIAALNNHELVFELDKEHVENGYGLLKTMQTDEKPLANQKYENITNLTRHNTPSIKPINLYLTETIAPTGQVEIKDQVSKLSFDVKDNVDQHPTCYLSITLNNQKEVYNSSKCNDQANISNYAQGNYQVVLKAKDIANNTMQDVKTNFVVKEVNQPNNNNNNTNDNLSNSDQNIDSDKTKPSYQANDSKQTNQTSLTGSYYLVIALVLSALVIAIIVYKRRNLKK